MCKVIVVVVLVLVLVLVLVVVGGWVKEEGGGGGKGELGRRKRKYTKLRKIENTLYRLKGRYPLTSKQRNKQRNKHTLRGRRITRRKIIPRRIEDKEPNLTDVQSGI